MTIASNTAYSFSNRDVHRAVLSNGMVVIAAANPAADIVATRIFIKVGSRYEPLEQAGISYLLSAVLTKGTEQLTSQEIAERVESTGASLGADSTADYSLLSTKTVSADFVDIFKLAAELLRSPNFPEAQVELERRLAIQGIRSSQEQPYSIAQQQLRSIMYGQHPYALSALGTEETISQISRDDLKHFHHTYFRPDNIVVSIAGRIDPEQAIATVDAIMGDWHPPKQADGEIAPLRSPTLPPIVAQPQQAAVAQQTQQAIIMLGYLGVSVHHPDYMVLKLLSTYLGNGLSSRLFVELREKQGLAYEVSGFYPTRLDPAQFVVYIGTAPENTFIALQGLHTEVNRLSDTHLLEEELQTAKNKLLGQYALGKQTNAQISQLLGWYETLGMGVEFDQQFQESVSSITTQMAHRVANQFLSEPFISLVGPDGAIDQLTSYTERHLVPLTSERI